MNNIPDLKRKFTKQMKSIDAENEKEMKLYEIALKHIEKYEPYLINESNVFDSNGKIIRTTSNLEQGCGGAKRIKRQVTGKKKLTREFNSLPKEYMIVQKVRCSSLMISRKRQKALKIRAGTIPLPAGMVSDKLKIRARKQRWPYQRELSGQSMAP